jgi:ubiquinone/menaquinone biosynthesis C-methylase UbiE
MDKMKDRTRNLKKKTPNDTTSYYDSISSGYNELHFEEQKKKFEILKNHLPLKKNSKVLDVGCGTFFSFVYFECDMQGIEPSGKMVELFTSSHPQASSRIMKGYADEIERKYQQNYFDFIICVSAVHHFKEPSAVFDQMKKIAKKNALFGITLLRNVKNFPELEKSINLSFKVEKVIDEPLCKDIVFICSNE